MPALSEPLLPETPEPEKRIRVWKERLLDLSLRNRLLNYKAAKSGIPILTAGLPELEDRLTAQALELRARPPDPGAPVEPDPAALIEDLARKILSVPLTPDEVYDRCVALDRAARLAREEGGANTLFLALGFLRWFEAGNTVEPREAPLLMLPVRLELDRVRRRVLVKRTDEDALGNVTLAELLKRDHAMDLTCLTQLAVDDAGVDVAAVLEAVRAAIRDL